MPTDTKEPDVAVEILANWIYLTAKKQALYPVLRQLVRDTAIDAAEFCGDADDDDGLDAGYLLARFAARLDSLESQSRMDLQ